MNSYLTLNGSVEFLPIMTACDFQCSFFILERRTLKEIANVVKNGNFWLLLFYLYKFCYN